MAPRKMFPAGHTTEPTFALIVDGEKHPIWFSEASARDVNDLRKSYHRGGLMDLQRALGAGDLDIDDVAALLWLSRRQTGEPGLTYDSVLDEISYETRFEIEVTETTVDDSPEA